MTKTANIIYAEIRWQICPCCRFDIKDEEVRDEEDGHLIETRYFIKTSYQPGTENRDETDNPANSDPEFWKHVANGLFSAFEGRKNIYGGRGTIEGFYREYGILAPGFYREPSDGEDWFESWGECLEALKWFNRLTTWFDLLKDGEVGRLRKLFEETWLHESDIPFYSIHRNTIYFEPPYPNDIVDYDFDTPALQNDDEVLKATWNVLTGEAAKLINLINLSPFPVEEDGKRSLIWQFRVHGAFEAAFLQWYFQELTPFELKKCANPNCDKLARLGSDYCGRRCAQATAKQRQRQRMRDAKKLHADDVPLNEIVKRIYPEEERDRLKDMGKDAENIVSSWLKKK